MTAKLILGLFSFVLFVSSAASAQSLTDSSRSLRARGMGGVLIPFVQGAEAIFVNPAALGTTGLMDLKVIDITLGSNSTTVDSLAQFESLNPDDSSTFNDFYGKKVWAKVHGKAAIALPYLAFGYLNDAEVSAQLQNPAFPNFETYFRQDTAVYLGGAISLGAGTYFGLTAKRISRWGGNTLDLSITDVADSGSITDIGNRFSDKGQAYGIDMALMHELQMPILTTTFALVYEDVGSTSFNRTEGTAAPPMIPQTLSFGVGTGIDLPGLDWVIGAEARHLLDSDMEIGKKLHLGTEISLPMIDLRAGFNQGYLSYGVGFSFLFLQLDAVSYKEELGVYPGQSGDQRYMASLSIDLSFDANFKFTDNNGKKRKLKLRR